MKSIDAALEVLAWWLLFTTGSCLVALAAVEVARAMGWL